MKIAMINGTMRRQSTYHIGKELINYIEKNNKCEVKEFFLPRDMNKFCLGCFKCFYEGEEKCPHYEELSDITKAIDESDLIIFTSPVYVYHVSGQMKTLLDHFGYRWMIHRPRKNMFKKQAVVISTCAGGGTKSTNKDILDSLFFLGVGKTYSYGKDVRSSSWDMVSKKLKEEINSDMEKISLKVIKKCGKVKPSLKVKLFFDFMRIMHKRGQFSKIDREYWESQGWLGKDRPWK